MVSLRQTISLSFSFSTFSRSPTAESDGEGVDVNSWSIVEEEPLNDSRSLESKWSPPPWSWSML